MKLTIKNLKVAKFASEETLCFEATIYINGRRSFTAHNDGNGGCNFYHGDRDKIRAAEEWAASQPNAYGSEDLDTEIDKAIEEIEITKDVKKILKKLAIFDAPNILTWKCTPDNERGRKFIAKNHPNAVILNDITLDEAVTIYKTI